MIRCELNSSDRRLLAVRAMALALFFVVTLAVSASVDPAARALQFESRLTKSGSEVTWTRERIPCGKDRVAVDVFQPVEDGRYPAVIMLHGSHGPGRAERYYLDQAQELASHGYVSLFVRYYDRGRRGRGNRQAWQNTISDALTFAINLDKVDNSRLALVGYSQGAFLALGAAPMDSRVRAVVAYYGGLSPGFKEPASKSMPPTLIFHGTSDRTVPVRRAVEATAWLKSNGQPADLIIYKGASHGFNLSSRGGVDGKASKDAWSRTISFLDFHLRYPAWKPAALPAPEFSKADAGEPAEGPFVQEPFETLPYLEEREEARDGEDFALINPDPEDVRSSVPQMKKKAKGSRHAPSKGHHKGSRGRKNTSRSGRR